MVCQRSLTDGSERQAGAPGSGGNPRNGSDRPVEGVVVMAVLYVAETRAVDEPGLHVDSLLDTGARDRLKALD